VSLGVQVPNRISAYSQAEVRVRARVHMRLASSVPGFGKLCP
jgi:hypothetical protein